MTAVINPPVFNLVFTSRYPKMLPYPKVTVAFSKVSHP